MGGGMKAVAVLLWEPRGAGCRESFPVKGKRAPEGSSALCPDKARHGHGHLGRKLTNLVLGLQTSDNVHWELYSRIHIGTSYIQKHIPGPTCKLYEYIHFFFQCLNIGEE